MYSRHNIRQYTMYSVSCIHAVASTSSPPKKKSGVEIGHNIPTLLGSSLPPLLSNFTDRSLCMHEVASLYVLCSTSKQTTRVSQLVTVQQPWPGAWRPHVLIRCTCCCNFVVFIHVDNFAGDVLDVL